MNERVCVIGELRLQNELVENYLKAAIGVDSVAYDQRNISFSPSPPDTALLILWDFANNDNSGLWTLLAGAAGTFERKHPVVVFNMTPAHDALPELVMSGVRGIFYNNEPASVLVRGIQAILKGELWVSRKQLEDCLFRDNPVARAGGRCEIGHIGLTPREAEVLAGIASGATNDEIAESLCVSISTIKTHNYRIFKKIGANNRMQASLWALKNLPSSRDVHLSPDAIADHPARAGENPLI